MRRQRVRAGVFHLLSVLHGQRAQFRRLPPGVRRLLDLVKEARRKQIRMALGRGDGVDLQAAQHAAFMSTTNETLAE
jgi:hypothetical protein